MVLWLLGVLPFCPTGPIAPQKVSSNMRGIRRHSSGFKRQKTPRPTNKPYPISLGFSLQPQLAFPEEVAVYMPYREGTVGPEESATLMMDAADALSRNVDQKSVDSSAVEAKGHHHHKPFPLRMMKRFTLSVLSSVLCFYWLSQLRSRICKYTAITASNIGSHCSGTRQFISDSFRTSRLPHVHRWIHNMHPSVVFFTIGNPHATRVHERGPPLCGRLWALALGRHRPVPCAGTVALKTPVQVPM